MDLNLNSVNIQPLVLVQIRDAFASRNADSSGVIGKLLGSVDKGVIEVTNCFCMPHKEARDQVEAEITNASDIYDLKNSPNSSESIVGWWAIENEVTNHSSFMHDTKLQDGEKGMKAYVYFPLRIPEGKAGFTPIKVETTCFEPKDIGMKFSEMTIRTRPQQDDPMSELAPDGATKKMPTAAVSEDDSSGEEDNVETYNIRTEINKFKDETEMSVHLVWQFILSFVVHAAGVCVLYCPAVQERYYALKKEYFGEEDLTSEPLKEPKFDLKETPIDDCVVKFLSLLRLHNRSEKRCLKRKVKCANTSWTFFKAKDTVRLNNVNVDYYRFGQRNEQVSLEGNYRIPYIDLLDNLTEYEKTILLETRANIMKVNGDSALITNRYLTLWYLLFGCEVIKNPAALITINMALDLIEAGKLDWGKEMIEITPMLSKGAIQEAMALNEHYTNFMPHPYVYQYSNIFPGKDKDNLVKREAEITEKWLELKLGKDFSTYIIDQCKAGDIDGRAAEKIWLKIMESFDGWGLNAFKQHPVAV